MMPSRTSAQLRAWVLISYRHLYMHRTGHWLGLDVHDVGAYRLGEQPVEQESGMVLTVDQGLSVKIGRAHV